MKMRRRYVDEKSYDSEKMRRDAQKIRRLFFDFVPMKVVVVRIRPVPPTTKKVVVPHPLPGIPPRRPTVRRVLC